MIKMITYPLNNIDYTAEDAELYFSTRESGVYDGNDFEVTVSSIDNDVTVGTGIAWIHNTKFSGKVVALKEPKTLTLSFPNSVYDRIDAIVIQFDANKNATEIVVKEGIASSAPIAPNVVRTESLYELHIFHVQRKAGASVIGVDDLIDLRNDSDYCGIMFDPISSVDSTLTKSGYAAEAKTTGDELNGKVSKSGDTIHGSLSVDDSVSANNFHSNYIELGTNLVSGTNFGGFIDFHYEGNPVDYTSRIIEDNEGSLNLQTPNGLRINHNALADFVIAQGGSGGWHYRKWNNGDAEIWRRDSYSVMMPEGTKGCAVDYDLNYAYPFTFTTITNVSVTLDNQNLQQWIGAVSFDTSNIYQVGLDSFYSVQSTGFMNIHIIGKWK